MPDPVIICVDDEKVILNSLQSQLSREFGETHAIEVAQSGEEALEIVEECLEEGMEIPIVITDQMMPGMKGHELLIRIHEILPRTFTVLLTGQSDLGAVSEAVNKANLYRYITKPWDTTDLNMTVREAIKGFQKDSQLEEQNKLLKEYNEQLEEKVRDRTKSLEEAQKKSRELLLNILPKETAEELIVNGQAKPQHFESATVLFADIVGFTKMTLNRTPEKLIEVLNECFSAFDEISSRNKLERIKTIGDAYMAVGGVPTPNSSHPIDAVNAAWEMMEWTKNWNAQREQNGLNSFHFRIGAHTGDLVAGVVGIKKFAYDVWGEAVNIAWRLEGVSEAGKINVSQSLKAQTEGKFSFESRGEIEVKNMGSFPMYFVEGRV